MSRTEVLAMWKSDLLSSRMSCLEARNLSQEPVIQFPSAPKMQAQWSSETLVPIYRTTCCHKLVLKMEDPSFEDVPSKRWHEYTRIHDAINICPANWGGKFFLNVGTHLQDFTATCILIWRSRHVFLRSVGIHLPDYTVPSPCLMKM
jgi:hypothetical protein